MHKYKAIYFVEREREIRVEQKDLDTTLSIGSVLIIVESIYSTIVIRYLWNI